MTRQSVEFKFNRNVWNANEIGRWVEVYQTYFPAVLAAAGGEEVLWNIEFSRLEEKFCRLIVVLEGITLAELYEVSERTHRERFGLYNIEAQIPRHNRLPTGTYAAWVRPPVRAYDRLSGNTYYMTLIEYLLDSLRLKYEEPSVDLTAVHGDMLIVGSHYRCGSYPCVTGQGRWCGIYPFKPSGTSRDKEIRVPRIAPA